MIDNFDKILNLIKNTTNENEFYFLQILKRRKDNPEMVKHVELIHYYLIKNDTHLNNIKNDIINLCHCTNSRAYFNLNKRNKKQVALHTLRRIADNIASENYNLDNCYLSCCGENCAPKDSSKTWIIDLDNEHININEIKTVITRLLLEAQNDPTINEMPTKNGIHLIARPFNLQEFKNRYPQIDVHKDNPTILYIPPDAS